MDGIEISSASVEEVVGAGIIARLDEDLLSRYPGEPVNGIVAEEFLAAGGYFLAARDGDEIVGCGAFRPSDLDEESVEIKRMHVAKSHQRRGVARKILGRLEEEARSRGFARSVLETAKRMPEAITLYASYSYEQIEKYEPYVESERSVCFAKKL